jgi:gluconate kinase
MVLIFISGISGVGKSTLSRELATRLNYKHINQDNYYIREKPVAKLSTGMMVRNWDTEKAIDFNKLNQDLRKLVEAKEHVILEGFCLRDDLILIKPNVHIHLSYIPLLEKQDISLSELYERNKEKIIPRIIAARSKSKPNVKDDKIVVKELVWPFYIDTLEHSIIHYALSTFDHNGGRIPLNTLVNDVVVFWKELAREKGYY